MLAWTAWLLIAAGACASADIGWPALAASWLALACTFSSYRRFVGLGERAVLAAGHDDEGPYILVANAPLRRVRVHSVQLRQFGSLVWVLRFSTAHGPLARLLIPGLQEPRTLRRWVRGLSRGWETASGQFGPRPGSS